MFVGGSLGGKVEGRAVGLSCRGREERWRGGEWEMDGSGRYKGRKAKEDP